MARGFARLKARLHPALDPWLSLPDERRARRALAGLADGEYHAVAQVPYYAQFASPNRIAAYIHEGYDGTQDPNWHTFGADDPVEYAFWAPRVCALACLKMAIEAFYPERRPTLWELVQKGLAHGGYTVRDAAGNWVDEGWTYRAQVALAAEYGLQAAGQGYARRCRSAARSARARWWRHPSRRRSGARRVPGGMGAICAGVRLRVARRPQQPTGCTTLQAATRAASGGTIPADRFRAAFAYRLIALRPAR